MKITRTFTAALAAASLLGGALTSGAQAQTMQMDVATNQRIASTMNANLDRLFLIHAADTNMFEIMAGRLALQRSNNAGVRSVAQMTIADHTVAQRDLKTHFGRLGVPVPSQLSVPKQAQYNALSRLRGAAFDKAYMGAQVPGHEATVVLFSHEIDAGRDEMVKAHARNKLPKILMHTAMIYRVAQSVGAPGIALRPAAVRSLATVQSSGQMNMSDNDEMEMTK